MATSDKFDSPDLSKGEREERIRAETKRLEGICKNIDKNKRKLAEGLIKRASFMRITLEDLENDINENGTVEMFTQSENTDPYERRRPNADIYVKMNSAYQNIMKQLYGIISERAGGDTNEKDKDGFDEFVRSR